MLAWISRWIFDPARRLAGAFSTLLARASPRKNQPGNLREVFTSRYTQDSGFIASLPPLSLSPFSHPRTLWSIFVAIDFFSDWAVGSLTIFQRWAGSEIGPFSLIKPELRERNTWQREQMFACSFVWVWYFEFAHITRTNASAIATATESRHSLILRPHPTFSFLLCDLRALVFHPSWS